MDFLPEILLRSAMPESPRGFLPFAWTTVVVDNDGDDAAKSTQTHYHLCFHQYHKYYIFLNYKETGMSKHKASSVFQKLPEVLAFFLFFRITDSTQEWTQVLFFFFTISSFFKFTSLIMYLISDESFQCLRLSLIPTRPRWVGWRDQSEELPRTVRFAVNWLHTMSAVESKEMSYMRWG